MLYNKLIRADLLLVICLLMLLFIHTDPWKSIFLGAMAACAVYSIAGHISHYKTYKKFY